MKAIFEYKEVSQDWNPPFKKSITVNDVVASEGQAFGKDAKGLDIFKVVKIMPDKALVEFSHEYTLKGHEHPLDRKVWITKRDYESFSSLWSGNGVTKKLKVKEIVP